MRDLPKKLRSMGEQSKYALDLLRQNPHKVLTFARCPLCGSPQWVGSKDLDDGVLIKDRPPAATITGHVVFERDGVICDYCLTIRARHPELFEWVSDVVVYQDAFAAAREEEARDALTAPGAEA